MSYFKQKVIEKLAGLKGLTQVVKGALTRGRAPSKLVTKADWDAYTRTKLANETKLAKSALTGRAKRPLTGRDRLISRLTAGQDRFVSRLTGQNFRTAAGKRYRTD